MVVMTGVPGKCLRDPGLLLRCGPIADRKAGQDDGFQMRNRIEQYPGIGHFRKAVVEIVGAANPEPEIADAVCILELGGAHSEQRFHPRIEIGEDAVEVEE